MTPLTNVLVSLRKEQARLERVLSRVNRAIDALTDAPAKKKVATKKKRKPMSAGDSLMKLLTNVLVSLREEQAHLERLLARVNRAIDALTDAPAKKKKIATKKKRKPMSAAARKAVSEKLKQYWAAKKTAGRKK